ncbi:hypothetical protein [Streptomyces sp. NPDC056600]|uniref:hypothetical protein n=1 Tax=Streptomyces sp. NPDC056600 TaxID=3345874 RepID=UPI0036920C08
MALAAAAVGSAASAGVAPAAAGVLAAPGAGQGCEGVGKGKRDFPVVARLRGPRVYRAGDVPQAWTLELTNRSARACAGLHPVVVLTDERRALLPAQAALFFFDGERPRAVDFEGTERDELVGVFGEDGKRRKGGFEGFTVKARQTLRVRVLLAVASDARANEVAAEAVVVRRTGRGGADGEWVGRSEDPYRFRISSAAAPHVRGAAGPSADRDPAFPWAPLAVGTLALSLTAASAWALRRRRRRS